MRRTMQRYIGALTVAVTLFLVLPAEAANGDWMQSKPSLIEQAWDWLTGWLTPGNQLPSSREGWTNVHENDGGAIDPNGRTSTTLKCRDDGGCIDPNG